MGPDARAALGGLIMIAREAHQPVLIPFSGPSTPWFVDPALRRVFSGADYNRRCIAVVGPHDLNRVLFRVTSNPRQLQWKLDRESDVPLIAHECWWSVAQSTKHVFAQVMALLDRAGIQPVNGWVTIPKTHVGPLLQLASDRAGVPSQRHADFHAYALDVETQKLRAQLTRANMDPISVAAHRWV